MKRNKIKNKYLNIINSNEQIIIKMNASNKFILNTLKSIGLILLMLIYNVIPLIILSLFNINYSNLSTIGKTIYLFICDIIFMLFLFFIYKKEIIGNFKSFFNKKIKQNIDLSIKYWLVGLLVMIVSNIIISTLNGGIAGNEESVRELINKMPLYMIFQVVIYAPFTEEIIFRRSIKDTTDNKYIYILASGLIFGGMHVLSNITTLFDLLYLIPYGALGIAFASLYNKTNNIFSSITMHSLHNTLTLILYFMGKIL